MAEMLVSEKIKGSCGTWEYKSDKKMTSEESGISKAFRLLHSFTLKDFQPQNVAVLKG